METLYRKVKNPEYQAYKKCKHENTYDYHDNSIMCRDCHCVISQWGEKTDNPEPVGGHFESEYYFEQLPEQKVGEEEAQENAAIWISIDENVPHLPKNSGELVAMLSKYIIQSHSGGEKEAQEKYDEAITHLASHGLDLHQAANRYTKGLRIAAGLEQTEDKT